ncbi:hypothetical protein CALVIDRAFT_568431 [Calocera viscosa TUFC12733]|uniref:Uncharacterized protein n=1 Tax=Calocera viscosa (strain TUFC12733) TaxID=1330018 RepID=A0A167H625_CALVF|nr:hypothetical protein CALVIDRAFT_568431 [Calocera viscosa TUFC12733]
MTSVVLDPPPAPPASPWQVTCLNEAPSIHWPIWAEGPIAYKALRISSENTTSDWELIGFSSASPYFHPTAYGPACGHRSLAAEDQGQRQSLQILVSQKAIRTFKKALPIVPIMQSAYHTLFIADRAQWPFHNPWVPAPYSKDINVPSSIPPFKLLLHEPDKLKDFKLLQHEPDKLKDFKLLQHEPDKLRDFKLLLHTPYKLRDFKLLQHQPRKLGDF